MKKCLFTLFIWMVVFSALSEVCLAQAGRGTGRLKGVVIDEAGNPISEAQVKLEYAKEGLKVETVTNKKGQWSFLGLGSGNAMIIVSADNFLPNSVQVAIKQLESNVVQKIVLKIDKSKAARVKNEATLGILDLGNQLFTERKFDEALEKYQQFAAENPTVFQILFNIGDCYREKGEREKALEQYNLALAKAKEKDDISLQAKAYSLIGDIYMRQDNLEQAMGFFKQSVDMNPQDEILAYNVAEIFFSSGKTEEAIKYYNLALQIKPQWALPNMKIGYALLNKGDIPQAIVNFQEFLKKDPQNSDAPVVQAVIDTLKKSK